MRVPAWKPALAAIVLLSATGLVAMAQGECKATMTVRYVGPDESTNTDFIDHVLAVEVQTKADCAKISYTLTVDERYPDGETRTKSKTWTQRFRSGDSKTQKVKYRIHRKARIDNYDIKVTGCRICGSE